MTRITLVNVEGQDAPIACSLTPDQYSDRVAELAALADDSLLSREPIDGGERLTFTDSPGVEQELRAAVAAEASCCSFLTVSLQRADAGLVLDVTGPYRAKPIIAELFA
jgi:hypothetical protein